MIPLEERSFNLNKLYEVIIFLELYAFSVKPFCLCCKINHYIRNLQLLQQKHVNRLMNIKNKTQPL